MGITKRVDSFATSQEAWSAIRLYEMITAGVDNLKSAKFGLRPLPIGKQTWWEVTVEIDSDDVNADSPRLLP